MTTLNATLRLRRDTAATWTSNNPTLASGEPGFETDTGKLKVGNGSDAWVDLDYIEGTGGGGGSDPTVPTLETTDSHGDPNPDEFTVTIAAPELATYTAGNPGGDTFARLVLPVSTSTTTGFWLLVSGLAVGAADTYPIVDDEDNPLGDLYAPAIESTDDQITFQLVPFGGGWFGVAVAGGAAGGGSGPDLSDADPEPLGTEDPGVSADASRADHVHAMPSAADVGAVPGSLIASTTLGSDQATVAFSSIPSTYKHLVMVVVSRTNRANSSDSVTVSVNSDTTDANYANLFIGRAYGGVVSADYLGASGSRVFIRTTAGNSGPASTVFASAIVEFPMYASTTFIKGIHSRYQFSHGSATSSVAMGSVGGTWNSTSAINAITLAPVNGTNFKTGTTVHLFGIG